MLRFAFVVALTGCWQTHAAPVIAPPAPPPPAAPSLAVEPAPPGQLLLDRTGRAWEVACTQAGLAYRPWEGGAFQPAGPCTDRIDPDPEYGAFPYRTELVWIDGPSAQHAPRVAVYSAQQRTLTIREHDAIVRTLDIPERVSVIGVAFDGDALVLAVSRFDAQKPVALWGASLDQALAALVRIEPSGKATARSLVDYLSTGSGFAPRFVIPSRDHLLLLGVAGGVRTCRYDLACGDISAAPRIDGGFPLDDGGAITYEHEHSVTRIAPNGSVAWTTKSYALGLYGASSTEIWLAEVRDMYWTHTDVVALDRATGKPFDEARARISRQRRDPLGNYLAIAGMAVTPKGPVIRGMFGGLLATGPANQGAITTKTRGAICWWENPHDGDRFTIPLSGSCSRPHAKAILTDHAAFVATHAARLRQRVNEPTN